MLITVQREVPMNRTATTTVIGEIAPSFEFCFDADTGVLRRIEEGELRHLRGWVQNGDTLFLLTDPGVTFSRHLWRLSRVFAGVGRQTTYRTIRAAIFSWNDEEGITAFREPGRVQEWRGDGRVVHAGELVARRRIVPKPIPLTFMGSHALILRRAAVGTPFFYGDRSPDGTLTVRVNPAYTWVSWLRELMENFEGVDGCAVRVRYETVVPARAFWDEYRDIAEVFEPGTVRMITTDQRG
jgi:hypothetical protein